MGASHWQPWENLFLHEVSKTMPLPVIAAKLERSESAIIDKARRLEIKLPCRMNGRPWTKAELFLLGRFTNEEIATATGRSIYSVRSKRAAMLQQYGGNLPLEWSVEELALLRLHTNAEIAEITGRSLEEIGDRRLQDNIERNGWNVFDPEREES
ncbi:hypothetical protein ACU63X_13305 [Klebsiella aerogenes]